MKKELPMASHLMTRLPSYRAYDQTIRPLYLPFYHIKMKASLSRPILKPTNLAFAAIRLRPFFRRCRRPRSRFQVSFFGSSRAKASFSLVIQRTLATPKVDSDEDWLRSNIFKTRYKSNGKVCTIVIDGGSCENSLSQEMVNKLKLALKPDPKPYRIAWFKKGNKINGSV